MEESPHLLQDFIATELRNIEARIAAAEARLDAVISTVENTMERNHKKMERNHSEVVDSLHRMEGYGMLAERLARVETKLQNVV